MSQSRRYTWRAQPQRHALRHLTTSTCSSSRLTLLALFEVKLQFVKVPCSTILNVDCSTLQTSRPNHPTTYTHTHTHTHKQQSVHACMHSFIHSFNPPYSLYHSFTRTNQASPLPFITITIIHPSTMHCTDHSVWHSYMHA